MRHPFRARLSACFSPPPCWRASASPTPPRRRRASTSRSGGGSVYVDSAVAAILDEEDNMQELFSYNGTIYIPLRQAGAWMGKQVDWDQQGKTVLLSGRTTARVLAAEEATGNQQTPVSGPRRRSGRKTASTSRSAPTSP